MKTKLKIPSMENDIANEKGIAVISFVIILIGMTAALVVFEIAFFHLLSKLWYSGRYELWIFQIVAVVGYLVGVYVTAYSKICRLLFLFAQLLLSCFVLGILMWIKSFSSLKFALILVIAMSLIGIWASVKSEGGVLTAIKVKSLSILLLITFSTVTIGFMFILAPKTIRIEPESEPELIFWCGSSQLPNDTETLEMAHKYNIAFAPTIRNSSVGDAEYMSVYKNIIAHKVSLHFAIGGTDEFYAVIDNSADFPEAYKNIRDWFEAEGILDSKYIRSFCVDAETPHKYIEEFEDTDPVDGINYLIDNFPTQEEIDEAEKNYQAFTDAIREDDKEAGIIRIAEMMDDCDGDGDMSLSTRNIYSLDVDWDYSVSMLYRTQHTDGKDDDVSPIEDTYNEIADIFMGIFQQGSQYTVSEYHFYNSVAMSQRPSEINVAPDRQHIFVGNFKVEFKDTDYIINKEYYKDVDICRHFGEEQIWFYELRGFVQHYGWEEMEKLGEYVQQHDGWDMNYDAEDSARLVIMYMGLILLDFFAKYEDDLL